MNAIKKLAESLKEEIKTLNHDESKWTSNIGPVVEADWDDNIQDGYPDGTNWLGDLYSGSTLVYQDWGPSKNEVSKNIRRAHSKLTHSKSHYKFNGATQKWDLKENLEYNNDSRIQELKGEFHDTIQKWKHGADKYGPDSIQHSMMIEIKDKYETEFDEKYDEGKF